MKKIEMYGFVKEFGLIEDLEGFEFVVATTRNLKLFKEEIDTLNKARIIDKKYLEYEAKAKSLVNKFAKKREDGTIEVFKNEDGAESYKVEPENREKLNKELEKLLKEYKPIVDKQTENEQIFISKLEDKIDFKLHMIKEDDLPKNITAKQLDVVFGMVEWNK